MPVPRPPHRLEGESHPTNPRRCRAQPLPANTSLSNHLIFTGRVDTLADGFQAGASPLLSPWTPATAAPAQEARPGICRMERGCVARPPAFLQAGDLPLLSPCLLSPVRGSSPAYSSALPGRRHGDLHAKRRNAVRFMQSGGPAQAAGLSGGGEQMALGEVKGIILSAGVSASHLDIPSTITRHFSRQNKGVFARRD